MPVINMLPHGGSESETVLWTNSKPSSAFADQTITLSESLEGYKKVRIYTLRNITETINEKEFIDIYLADGMIDWYTKGADKGAFAIAMQGTKYDYARLATITTAKTGVTFSKAYRLNSTSGHSSNYCVPVKISGIK
jgi:hypothetical protein